MMLDGWEIKKLEDLCSPEAPITYGVLKPGDYFPDGIPLLQIKDLSDGEVVTHNLHLISPKLDEEYKRSRITQNDILISLVGTIGRVAKYKSTVAANIHRNIGRVRSDSHEFLFHFLSSDIALKEMGGSSSGSSQSALNLSTLRTMKVPVPPISEQEKIAQILSTWDKAITTTTQLLTISQQQKKALMQQLLTGTKRLLDSEGVRFSGEWSEDNLKKLLSISKGQQLNRNTLSKSGEFPVINGGVEPSGFTNLYNTEANTITISEGGNSCGYIGFQTKRFWCGGHCYTIHNTKMVLNFTYQILKFSQTQIMRLRVGSGLPNIQKKDLEALRVRYPVDPEEQHKIAAVLTNADQEVIALHQKLDALKQEKKALMQQLLTGKRRVKIEDKEVA